MVSSDVSVELAVSFFRVTEFVSDKCLFSLIVARFTLHGVINKTISATSGVKTRKLILIYKQAYITGTDFQLSSKKDKFNSK